MNYNPEHKPEHFHDTNDPLNQSPAIEQEPSEAQEDPLNSLVSGVNPDKLTDEALDDLIDQHPEVQESVLRLKEARNASVNAKTTEMELMEEIRNKRQAVAGSIMERLGIQIESAEDKEKREESERLEKLRNIKKTLTGKEDDDELLSKFELTDENGKMSDKSIYSPLFKPDTRLAFKTYLRFASNYDAMEKAQISTGAPIKNAQKASMVRREAHDTVAKQIMQDLGLSFDESRRIVSKMRESVIPNSGEKMTYSQLLRGAKIAERYREDAAMFAEEELGPLLHPNKNDK